MRRFCDGLTRRNLLRAGLAGGLAGLGINGFGLGLDDFLRLRALQAAESDGADQNGQPSSARKATADNVLFVNLEGGVSHLDTLDMKPHGPSETRGEFGCIPTKLAGLECCEYLPKFAAVADRFALLRGICHSAGSHPQGQSYISTGNRPSPAVLYPSLGSVVGKELPGLPDLPPYVAIPVTEWNAGYLGDAYAPLKTNAVPKPGEPFQVRGVTLPPGLTLEKVRRRQELLTQVDRTFREIETGSQLLEALDTFGQQAHNMITSARSRQAFDVSQEPASVQKLFSGDDFNQSLLLGCRLIEFGVRFVTVSYAGWDTHTDNFVGHKKLLGPLDAGLAALVEMLQVKGLLERTLVVIMGEFGRTPKINQNAGRDHWPQVNWCLMIGGGVQTGQIIGGTDAAGAAPDDATKIHPDDIAASIYHSLGIDPLTEYYTNTGRPVLLVPHGNRIPGLFA